MKINPSLSFKGQCEDAFKFYEKNLGAKIQTLMKWDEAPADMKGPEGWGQKVMHGTIEIDGQIIMGGDPPPDYYKPMQGITLAITIDDMKKAETLFAALSEQGTVTMPMQETFWAKRFGMCVDKFGTPWMINCDMEQAQAA